MTKNFYFLAILIIIVAFGAVLGVRLLTGEDTWVCEDGQWVKHGRPSADKPTEGCGDENNNNGNNQQEGDVVLQSHQPNTTISSPVTLTGKARGTWYFEASFPARVYDANGIELGVGVMQAQSDWMTTDYVNFLGEVQFTTPTTETGKIVLQKDNPSGLPENDKSIEIPVKFGQVNADKMMVKVYFNNSVMDPEYSCNKVFAVNREIPKTTAVARAALEELFKGPTQTEKNQGFFTSINTGVKIQSLTVVNGVAKVDFNEQLQFQVGGSCKVSAIRAQITETLKQFSTVNSAEISIDGRVEDILQP